MKKALLISALTALTFLSGCSSIISGTTQVISVESNVKDAEVFINQVAVGKTPFAGKAPRSKAPEITVKKQGYVSRTIIANTEFEPYFWGNILAGGSFGSSTDAGTGAMYKYAPASFNIELQPEGK